MGPCNEEKQITIEKKRVTEKKIDLSKEFMTKLQKLEIKVSRAFGYTGDQQLPLLVCARKSAGHLMHIISRLYSHTTQPYC